MKYTLKPKKQPLLAQPAAPPSWSWTRFGILALCMLTAFGATWTTLEFVVWNRLPAVLVGKWVAQDRGQEGATFDFFRDGTMVARINVRGKEGIINARVAVKENTLHITTMNPHTKQDETMAHSIVTLTATELVLQDQQKNRSHFLRAE